MDLKKQQVHGALADGQVRRLSSGIGGRDPSNGGEEAGGEGGKENGPLPGGGGEGPIREVVKSAGLVFSEKSEHQYVLSKPKIMPIKSRATEAAERRMKEAAEVAGGE